MLTPTTLVAAAIAVTVGTVYKFVAVAEESARAANAIQTAFAAVGHAGMISGQGVEELVAQLTHLPGVNREAADQIITDFARTRQIGGQLFGALTSDIDKSARAMGVDAPESAKRLAAAFADPTKGAKDLDAEFNILNTSQLRQIETLQRQGDRIGAQNVLLQAWKARLAELPSGLTAIQTASNNLGTAWDKLLHGLGQTSAFTEARNAVANFLTGLTWVIGGNDAIATLDQQIAAAKRRVGELQQLASRPTMGGRGNFAGQLQQEQAELAALEARKRVQEQQAGKIGGQPTATDKRNEIAEQRKADLTDPSLIPVEEQIEQIEQHRLRLQQDMIGASAAEKEQLQARIALLDKQEADLKKPDKVTGAPTQLELWREELAQRQETFAKEHAADRDYHAQSLALEAEFWTGKVKLAANGSKEKVEAEKAASDAEKRLYEEQAQEAARLAKEKQEIAKQDAATDIEIAKIQLNQKKQVLEDEVAAGKITAAQQIATLKDFTEAAYREDQQRLQNELSTLAQQPKEYDRVYNEIRKLKAQHDADMATLDREAAQQVKKDADASAQAWKSALQPISSAFSSSISGMIQGTQTLRQAEARLAQSILMSFIDTAQKSVVNWAATELAKTTATQAGVAQRLAVEHTGDASLLSMIGGKVSQWFGMESSKTAATVAGNTARTAADTSAAATTKAVTVSTATASIGTKAADAAAGAYDAMAGIPIVGPALGAAAAAATFAAVLAYQSIASAEGGWGQVPFDGAAAILHKNEMVLPASLANPMRSMLHGGPLTAAAGGDVNLHYAPTVNAGGDVSLEKLLMSQGSDMMRWVKNQARNGAFR